MKIIIIEDNEDISSNIKKFLELDWIIVAQCFDGESWLKMVLSYDFDLVLLDYMLPNKDWIEVCREIRKKKDLPIIMMTAKWEDDDKILWLESGADDYIVKPFKIRELVARIKAIAKRSGLDDVKKIDDIEINIKEKTVIKAWEIINLALKEYQILECILKNKTITRTTLIESVWSGWEDDLFTADNKLDVYISNIRKKLWKDIIKTIKWYGYSIKS